MKTSMRNPTNRLAGLLLVLTLCGACWLRSGEPAPAWPRRVVAAPLTVALYEPQVESYDQDWVTGHAAVSVAKDAADPVFGAVWFGLRLTLNADKTLGRVSALRVDQARFPEADVVDSATLERLLGNSLIGTDLAMAPLLQSLEQQRAAAEAANAGSTAVPDILYTTVPVALVRIDGEPELKAVPDSDLLVVVNSTTPILLQKGSAKWFMQVEARWLTAPAVSGPWQDAAGVPDSVKKAVESGTVAAPAATPPLQIVVVTRATEVIQTEGEPRYTVIPGTDLLYVNNTDADLFLDIAGQKHYALLAGRWFAAVSLEKGPWEVVAPDNLPKGFAAIPPGSLKYGALAHVPGTTVAREAVQDAQVPRVQSVKRDVVNVTVEYEGDPQFVQAGQTTVYYAVNTPYSVLRVDPYYYLCDSGIWYYGVTAVGPWTVCTAVPGVIYTVPPTCPVYPVTYVRVYDWTPDYVYFGFTSGYVGWYVGWSGLVFGISYYDDDWWHHHHGGHYHHNYHCGYRPDHGWDRDWDRGHGPVPPPRPGFPGGLPGHLSPRPGPEYHAFSGGRGAARAPSGPVAEARPDRYTPDRHTPTRYAADRGPLAMGRQPVSAASLPGGRAGRVDRATMSPDHSGTARPGAAVGEARGDRNRPLGRDEAPSVDRTPRPGAAAPVVRGGEVRGDGTPSPRPGASTPERTAPVARPTAPVQERSVPVARPTAPVQERSAPVARPTVPVQERSAPVARPTVPVQERSAPVARPTAPVQERSAPTPSTPTVPTTPSTPRGGSGSQRAPRGLNSSFFEQRQAESAARETAGTSAPTVRYSPTVSTPVVSTPVVSPAAEAGGSSAATRVYVPRQSVTRSAPTASSVAPVVPRSVDAIPSTSTGALQGTSPAPTATTVPRSSPAGRRGSHGR